MLFVIKKNKDCGFDNRYMVVESSDPLMIYFLREHFSSVHDNRENFISLQYRMDEINALGLNTKRFWDLAKKITTVLELEEL